MSWLHVSPALSCGNDGAKPMFQITQLGCACGEGSGACAENPTAGLFLRTESASSFLTFPPGEDRKLLLHGINTHQAWADGLCKGQGGFGLQGPHIPPHSLAQTPKDPLLPWGSHTHRFSSSG